MTRLECAESLAAKKLVAEEVKWKFADDPSAPTKEQQRQLEEWRQRQAAKTPSKSAS